MDLRQYHADLGAKFDYLSLNGRKHNKESITDHPKFIILNI